MGSHIVAVDNLSTLPDWLSDALCRACTGDGDVRRRLYANGELYVTSFRRFVIINGIDIGAVRDDLADRLVTVDLHRIKDAYRQRDAELTQRWRRDAPLILGGLLDLAAKVLAVLPDVHLARSPRMADFARVLAAVDVVTDTDGMSRYRELASELASDAVTSDPVLSTLTATVTQSWTGAAAQLLEKLTASLGGARPPKDWPSVRALGGLLKRKAPSLRRVGWTVEQLDQKNERGQLWRLTPPSSPDEDPDEEFRQDLSSGFRQDSAPAPTCEDVNPPQILTN